MKRQKKKCDECGKLSRTLYQKTGNFLCHKCYRKHEKVMNLPSIHLVESLEKAQNKIRKVYVYKNKKNQSLHCMISVPSCYDGKKVRVIVAENEIKNK